jgi:hypothetical protein
MTLTQEPPRLARPPAAPAANLGPLELLDFLQEYAHSCAGVLPRVPSDLNGRAYELLELTDDLEVWAIHWPQGHGLELHDHGGSAGALWVVGGALEEHYIRTDRSSARRSVVAGGGVAFGAAYIHDVVNPHEEPATSLHAYSPPMASMTFYRQEGAQLLVDRAEYRADPGWAP